jgi:tetratricopeptide (TPR) repeat protein
MRQIGELSSNPEVLCELYKCLASLYKMDGNMEFRALALEKAIENRPNDIELRFSAAYTYSEVEQQHLTVLHYSTLLKFDSNHSAALNNLGVSCEKLNMPINSISSYKKAAKSGNTLAVANLANRYMNVGFAEEANKILSEAMQVEAPHENIGSSFAHLSDIKEKEEKLREETLEVARQRQRYLQAFADAYFSGENENVGFEGSWEFSDDITIEFEKKDDTITTNWVQKDVEHKLTGYVKNRGAKATFYKMTKDYFSETKKFTKEADGYFYLSHDGERIEVMRLEDGKHSFITMPRKEMKLLTEGITE